MVAWVPAVYSQSSREFGMSLSAGGAFLPSPGGVALSVGQERIGPVEHRRSQRRVTLLNDGRELPEDHTFSSKRRGYPQVSRNLANTVRTSIDVALWVREVTCARMVQKMPPARI